MATDCRASAGHSLNQSMVQQLTSEGNCLRRARKTSPMGLREKDPHEAQQYGLRHPALRACLEPRIRVARPNCLSGMVARPGAASLQKYPPTSLRPRVARGQLHVPHAQHHVDVVTHTPGIGGHEIGFGRLQALLLYVGPHGVDDLVLLICTVEVGDVT